jgi:hypothetical protein
MAFFSVGHGTFLLVHAYIIILGSILYATAAATCSEHHPSQSECLYATVSFRYPYVFHTLDL